MNHGTQGLSLTPGTLPPSHPIPSKVGDGLITHGDGGGGCGDAGGGAAAGGVGELVTGSMSLSEIREIASRRAAHGDLPSSTNKSIHLPEPIVNTKIIYPTQQLRNAYVCYCSLLHNRFPKCISKAFLR